MAEPRMDPSKPLSALLRDATTVAHDRVMMPAFVDSLIKGNVPTDHYVFYLASLYRIYCALEESLDTHPTHPCLASTYNPPILARSDALHRDVSFLLDDPNWDKSEKGKEILNKVDINPQVGVYVARLKQLGSSTDDRWMNDHNNNNNTNIKPFMLLAHSYTRYLGDLSGGQTMRRSVIKAYIRSSATSDTSIENNQAPPPSLLESQQGVEFYEFSALNKPEKLADPGEIKKLKAWFRSGLDEAGLNMTDDEKGALAGEALYAFDLNFDFFAFLSPTKPTGPAPSAPMKGVDNPKNPSTISKNISTIQRIVHSDNWHMLLSIVAVLLACVVGWVLV